MELSVPYTPRDCFIPFHQRNQRWSVMCCHRRAGKTVACIADLVIRAIYTQKPNAKFAYLGPYRQQAKEIAWTYLKDMTAKIRKGPPRESDLRVTLINGAQITIYGADNPDSIRGLYFDGMVIDEYADMRPSLWGTILLPTLIDRRGWATFIGTMRGKNHFYQTLERAETKDNWFHKVLKASESGLLRPQDLEEMRSEMSDEEWMQEMECDPNAAVKGTYYSGLISKLEEYAATGNRHKGYTGDIGEYPRDYTNSVNVSIDLGYTDSMALWFWHMDDKGPIFMDYEEHDSKPLQFYFDLLDEKGYEFNEIWVPHDAKAKTLQTGKSTIELFQNHFRGKADIRGVPKLSKQHGIDATRSILPHCRFDKTACYDGIEALRAYRRQFNDKTQQYSNEPLHDWSSNGADSFRYAALAIELPGITTKVEAAEDEPLLKAPQYTLDELFKERENWQTKRIRL